MIHVLFLISLIFLFAKSEPTVKTLDLEKYSGRWYQVYGNNFDQLFEKFCTCITADYKIEPTGNVSVINSQYNKDHLEQIYGYAYYSSSNPNPKLFPGQLTVHLDGVPRDAPYWVYNLGPELNNLYEWSIVSDPLKISLFVLARDVDRYFENYDEQVQNILTDYGFYNLVKVEHENCVYV
jgi:apolipoprotein D and lipocalin family protein